MNPQAFDEYWLARDFAGGGLIAPTELTVKWPHYSGIDIDEATGANRCTPQIVSGTLTCFIHEEPARSVVRQHAEIQTGDLIIDCAADAAVSIVPGQLVQSGTALLDDLETPSFHLHGRKYVQKQVGEALARSWDLTEGGRKIERTILLTLSE